MSGTNPDYNEIVIDGWHFPLQTEEIQASGVDRFPGKVTVGDYSKDSNDLLSTWVISDLTGGHGVVELKEGVDDNRYRFGTIYTRYPGQFTLPFYVNGDVLGSGAVLARTLPLADSYYDGTGLYEFYALGGATGFSLFRDHVDTGQSLSTAGNGEKAVSFIGAGPVKLLYIPLGTSGYATYNRGTNTLTENAGVDVISFALWDDKLIAIDGSGQLYYATAAEETTSFNNYGTGGKLDESHIPRRLEVYYNRVGEPSIHVITDQSTWVFDAATPRLYQIPDLGGAHPYFGYASCVWRGNLYVSSGMDLLEWNGSVIRNIGLSRDEGLPYNYQNVIWSLAAGQNALYASVLGHAPDGQYYHSVHEWSGFGWHCVYTELLAEFQGPNTNMMVSRAAGNYRLYWGHTAFGDLAWQELPTSFTNPREAIAAGGFTFGKANSAGATYYLETGRFDANMKGYNKIAAQVEMDVRQVALLQSITLKYRVDLETDWTDLGTTTTEGHNVFQFGTPDADGIYPGIPFETIEFRLEYVDDDAPSGETSVVDSLVFAFLKVMNPSWSWSIPLDLTAPHNGYSPEQLYDKLVDLKNSGVFYGMKHRDDVYRIRIAQMSGAEKTGNDKRGYYTISGIEIPTRLGVAS